MDINSLSRASNIQPNIGPTQMISPSQAPFIALVNKLFGSQGPLASYRLQSIEVQGADFIIGVAGAWRPEVARAIEATIKRYADGDINTQGWTFKVTDVSNEEGVQPRS